MSDVRFGYVLVLPPIDQGTRAPGRQGDLSRLRVGGRRWGMIVSKSIFPRSFHGGKSPFVGLVFFLLVDLP